MKYFSTDAISHTENVLWKINVSSSVGLHFNSFPFSFPLICARKKNESKNFSWCWKFSSELMMAFAFFFKVSDSKCRWCNQSHKTTDHESTGCLGELITKDVVEKSLWRRSNKDTVCGHELMVSQPNTNFVLFPVYWWECLDSRLKIG